MVASCSLPTLTIIKVLIQLFNNIDVSRDFKIQPLSEQSICEMESQSYPRREPKQLIKDQK